MTDSRGWLVGVSTLALASLSACVATGATHPTVPSETATPENRSAPAAVSAPPASAPMGPPQAVTPEAPSTAQPIPAPQTEPAEQLPPTAAPNELPPCLPAHPKARPKRRHHAKQPQGPEPPSAPQTRPDTAVDAQVGQIGAPLASILGKNVVGPQGEALGRVADVLADQGGRVRVAIIDFGGFLGVGTRRIAVDWPLLRFNPNAGANALVLSVTREKLMSAPEYKDSSSPRVLMPPGEALHDAADNSKTGE
jgi:PRC-barrel domain